MLIRQLLLFLVVLLFTNVSEARVFSYQESSVAAYIRGTGATSGVAQDPFGNSSGSNTYIDGKTRYSYSGEVGAAVSLASTFIMRLGAEVIQHHPVKDESGFNSLEQKRFSMDSSVFVFNPNLTFEYVYNAWGNMRFYGLAGAGLASATVENRYRMTTQGTLDLAVNDFTEKLEGTGISYHAGVGFETLFTDNATISADVGYRHLRIEELKHKHDGNTIVEPGGVTAGDTAKNHDGVTRTLDLGGIFVGITFRFYLNFM